MRISLLALVLVFIASAINAQNLPVSYDEEFSSNTHDWFVGNNSDREMRVENGQYLFKKKSEGGWSVWITKYINPDTDYDIEAEMTQTAGPEDNGYGLMWGNSKSSDAYAFSVSSNGYTRVNKWVDNKFEDVVAWEESSAVKGFGQKNVLTVSRRGSVIRYFVNGTQVSETPLLPIKGFILGLRMSEQMTLLIDRVTIRQVPTPINVLQGLPTNLKKERLSTNVNSPTVEKSPLVSNDGTMLFICRGDHPENVPTNRDDIWVSRKQPDGSWGKAERFPMPVNNAGHNFVISVSPDNNRMLVGNTYTATGEPEGAGVSLTERTATGWTIPKKVVIEDYVNRDDYTESCMSPDGNTLIMTVERDGCIGRRDMHVSFRKPDGSFTKPMNMGPGINSIGDEEAPFLAADGSTLYFGSDGRPGYGSTDIFMSRRLDSTWMNWSEPVNLGPTINDNKWNSYYTVPADGAYAYYVASTDDSDGDVWRMDLPKELQPRPVVLVSGKVFDAKTKQPLSTSILVELLSNGASVTSATTDPVTGEYKIILYAGEDFGFLANKSGYFPVSENLSTHNLDRYTELKRDLYLEPIEAGRAIRLNNVFFDTGLDVLNPTSHADLNRLAQLLQQNPGTAIEISGHTDDVGADAANKELSQRRANSVQTYLVGAGVDKGRMTAKGYGETRPVTKAITPEARQQNRRVEFMIIGK